MTTQELAVIITACAAAHFVQILYSDYWGWGCQLSRVNFPGYFPDSFTSKLFKFTRIKLKLHRIGVRKVKSLSKLTASKSDNYNKSATKAQMLLVAWSLLYLCEADVD